MPAEGRLAAGRRRRREHAQVVASGLVDPAWVAAQLAARGGDGAGGGGRALDVAGAARLLLEDPDLSPHPLIEPSWAAPGRPWLARGATGTGWYLRDAEHRLRSPHPLVSLSVIHAQVPGAIAHPGGPVAAWLEHVGHSPDALLPARAGTPPTRLGDVRRAALAALARRPAPVRAVTPEPSRPPSAGLTSVVVVGHDPARTVNWIRSVAEASRSRAGQGDVEVVAVAASPARAHRVLADTVAAAYGVAPMVVVDAGADLVAVGLAHASGERVVLVRAGVVPDAAAALDLAAVLSGPGPTGPGLGEPVVQPLLVGRDGVLLGAGAVLGADGHPEAFLAGHSPADAEALGRAQVPGPLAPVTAFRAGRVPTRALLVPEVRFVVPRGLAPADLPTSLSSDLPTGPGGSEAEDRLHRAGLARLEHQVVRAPGRPRITESPPRLRWSIDTAARAGSGGETWGDTHFARSLAHALRRRGQHVAVDPAPARDRATRRLDDVVLVLRGLDRVSPSPGPLHLLWVISHPDLVTAEEVAAYDGAFAASLSWSAARTRAWGLVVEPLLQCTDPALFHPGRAEPDTGAPVLFVGGSRGVLRPALAGALAAGVPVQVHGGGWGAVLPDLAVRSTQVANADLGALYAGAGVVLNDHWADMRRDGFVSNRLFDATACAARVISDDIAGLAELFEGRVQSFVDPAEVGGLIAAAPGATSYADRVALARRVGAEHSFENRAETLLEAAVRLRPHPVE